MYSKKLYNFQPVDIKLLRSIFDIYLEYDGIEVESEYGECSNIEAGEICQLMYSFGFHVGYFNESGSGTTLYSVFGDGKFIENYDFVFI